MGPHGAVFRGGVRRVRENVTEFGKPERVGKGVKGWRMYKITVRTKSRVRVQRVYNPFSVQFKFTTPLRAALGRHAPRAARGDRAPGRYVTGYFPRKQAGGDKV